MANLSKREREPRPVRYSVQLVALVEEGTGDRITRLVKATKLSMAEILRQALESALPALENYYHQELVAAGYVAAGRTRRATRSRKAEADPAA